jgi:hypothetical protein
VKGPVLSRTTAGAVIIIRWVFIITHNILRVMDILLIISHLIIDILCILIMIALMRGLMIFLYLHPMLIILILVLPPLLSLGFLNIIRLPTHLQLKLLQLHFPLLTTLLLE